MRTETEERARLFEGWHNINFNYAPDPLAFILLKDLRNQFMQLLRLPAEWPLVGNDIDPYTREIRRAMRADFFLLRTYEERLWYIERPFQALVEATLVFLRRHKRRLEEERNNPNAFRN